MASIDIHAHCFGRPQNLGPDSENAGATSQIHDLAVDYVSLTQSEVQGICSNGGWCSVLFELGIW
jgi:hypothetical protein